MIDVIRHHQASPRARHEARGIRADYKGHVGAFYDGADRDVHIVDEGTWGIGWNKEDRSLHRAGAMASRYRGSK
ncbi:MAG TPA: hypothetical protein VFD36_29410 [Kofleriaceae bacterium]|nr:hypothetical protein [Kofleriaceae bacterium]